jgi:hypothetical protein
MILADAPPAADRSSTPSPAVPVGALVRDMVRGNLPWLLVFVGGVAVIHTAIAAGIVIWGEPGASVWGGVHYILQWAALATGIALGAWFPVAVAHGATRGATSAAAVWVMLGAAAVLAVSVQAGLAVEWATYRVAGFAYRLDGEHWFDKPGQVHLVLPEHFLLFAGFAAAGWLVYLGYYRFGSGRGTLLLPLALLPAAGTLAAVSAGRTPHHGSPGFVGILGLPAAAALTLLMVGSGLLAIRLTSKSIPIRPK